ncbi:extensin-like [Malania oleifera]|uniref:extensin-like n=1 Tax=Malania oleifera TaxID=397392 RepID=UPI0025AE7F2B|nr:extensin-like [Malania oleifera]
MPARITHSTSSNFHSQHPLHLRQLSPFTVAVPNAGHPCSRQDPQQQRLHCYNTSNPPMSISANPLPSFLPPLLHAPPDPKTSCQRPHLCHLAAGSSTPSAALRPPQHSNARPPRHHPLVPLLPAFFPANPSSTSPCFADHHSSSPLQLATATLHTASPTPPTSPPTTDALFHTPRRPTLPRRSGQSRRGMPAGITHSTSSNFHSQHPLHLRQLSPFTVAVPNAGHPCSRQDPQQQRLHCYNTSNPPMSISANPLPSFLPPLL